MLTEMKVKILLNILIIVICLVNFSKSGGPSEQICDPFTDTFISVVDEYIVNITATTENAIDELLTLNSSFYELPERDFDIRAEEISTICIDRLLNDTSVALNAAQILTNVDDKLIVDLFMHDTDVAPYPLSCIQNLIYNLHDMLYDSMDEVTFATQEIKNGHVGS